VIAELLEPVIRHWLDNNLPRMVEKVVREEVARSLAAERAAPKADA
jgi:cell pole-organizing protein PopZ